MQRETCNSNSRTEANRTKQLRMRQFVLHCPIHQFEAVRNVRHLCNLTDKDGNTCNGKVWSFCLLCGKKQHPSHAVTRHLECEPREKRRIDRRKVECSNLGLDLNECGEYILGIKKEVPIDLLDRPSESRKNRQIAELEKKLAEMTEINTMLVENIGQSKLDQMDDEEDHQFGTPSKLTYCYRIIELEDRLKRLEEEKGLLERENREQKMNILSLEKNLEESRDVRNLVEEDDTDSN